MQIFNKICIIGCLLLPIVSAFTVPTVHLSKTPFVSRNEAEKCFTSTQIQAVPDYDVVALVAGQENYGFAIVALGEALWSFSAAPSLSHAKVLIPASVAAIVLFAVSGPLVTNAADQALQSLGLEIATAVSVGLGASYIARLLAPFSPSAKEIAFLGLLVSIAGFFSFSQNLIVDGFVTLPSLPSVPLPSLPSITLPFVN